jgi:CRP-like cAMP-binding protein
VDLILTGIACRYKMLPEGRRQITAYLIPGDTCDLRVSILRRRDHSVGALSECRVARISPESVAALLEMRGALNRALWWSTLVEESVTREWILNVGPRSALARTAHLLCETFLRLRAVGLVDAHDSCDMNVTQIDLAETLALSPVHVNRTIQRLRRDGLVSLAAGRLTIHDLRGLQEVGQFNADYLHLEPEQTPSTDMSHGTVCQAGIQA